MSEEPVLYEVADRVATITLNRPDVRNAMNTALREAMLHRFTALATDDEVRVIVVTGAGDRAFSAGADLKERRGMSEEQTRARIDLINRTFDALAELPKLTVAAVNGIAFGGGLELALACDLRLAVEGAQLGLTEVKLGIMPGAGGTERLPRAVGAARAKEMILLGRRLSAAQALVIGLVHEVVPASGLVAAVERLAEELEGCAPVSVAMAKRAIDHGGARACYETTLATEDRNEGLLAFAERRPPRYQGR
jgi:enoyl-CoA hydratase/carnithine racemase